MSDKYMCNVSGLTWIDLHKIDYVVMSQDEADMYLVKVGDDILRFNKESTKLICKSLEEYFGKHYFKPHVTG